MQRVPRVFIEGKSLKVYSHDDIFVFYREEEYERIKEECIIFNDFGEVLDYAIDIVDEEE